MLGLLIGEVMPAIIRTEEEIDEVLNFVAEGEDCGTHYPAASYEQGIRAMYEWLIGDTDCPPSAER